MATIVVGTNSWVTLAEADAYFLDRINSGPWDALSPDDKNKYLISAYTWLFYDPSFSAPADSTSVAVKNGQCEAALFLINYGAEYAKRDALIASGVKEFDYSKWSETLGEVTKPSIVINMFSSVGYYAGGNGFAYVENDQTDV